MSRQHGRAVSDLVAFTLVFSTIIFMIGVVTITGIGTLGDVQAGTEANVAQETMRNYASTLADHRTTSADQRSVTMKLQGHSLRRVDSTLGWSVDGGSRTDITTGALVRETDTDTQIAYESGGLFRLQDGGGLVVRQPPMRCGDDTAHLAVTKVRGDFSVASEGRVTLQSALENQHITTRDADRVTLYADGLQSPGQWGSALGGGWSGSSAGPNAYECSGIDRVVVHETTVRIDVVN